MFNTLRHNHKYTLAILGIFIKLENYFLYLGESVRLAIN